MEKEKQNLEVQDHPLKNTDDAFVQVGKNGEPVMPASTDEKPGRRSPEENAPDVYDRP